MTRINLIPVEELSDQHLLAEYRELPRIVNAVIANKLKSDNVPLKYTLGLGHMRFFTNKLFFLAERYRLIFEELKYRGFELNPKFNPEDMLLKINNSNYKDEIFYNFSDEEIAISRNRIKEKIQKKPLWYRWSKRARPSYI